MAGAGASSGAPPRWDRIVLKLSGEAFAGEVGMGIDGSVVSRLAEEVAAVRSDLGVDVAIVVGEGIEKKQSDFAAEVAAMTKTAA